MSLRSSRLVRWWPWWMSISRANWASTSSFCCGVSCATGARFSNATTRTVATRSPRASCARRSARWAYWSTDRLCASSSTDTATTRRRRARWRTRYTFQTFVSAPSRCCDAFRCGRARSKRRSVACPRPFRYSRKTCAAWVACPRHRILHPLRSMRWVYCFFIE